MLEGLLQGIKGRLGFGARKRTSALYTFLNTNTIASGAEAVMDLELVKGDFSISNASVAEIQDQVPFTNLSIANGDTSNSVRVIVNNEPSHSAVALPRASEDLEAMNVIRFKVTNLGSGTIVAGAVIVTVWNE